MRNSRRLKRMSRNRGKISKMNLTSLMDVFTILVFFLLVNSGSVEILDAPKDVKLPESQVETKPRETVIIFVSPEEILVQGVPAGLVEDVLAGDCLVDGSQFTLLVADDGNGRLDGADVVAHCWRRPPAVSPLGSVYPDETIRLDHLRHVR